MLQLPGRIAVISGGRTMYVRREVGSSKTTYFIFRA